MRGDGSNILICSQGIYTDVVTPLCLYITDTKTNAIWNWFLAQRLALKKGVLGDDKGCIYENGTAES